MSKTDDKPAAPCTRHALGCVRPPCIGSCLKPSENDPLEVRVARYDEAMREHEEAGIEAARAHDAYEAAHRALNTAWTTSRCAADRASKASDAVKAARAALLGTP